MIMSGLVDATSNSCSLVGGEGRASGAGVERPQGPPPASLSFSNHKNLFVMANDDAFSLKITS